MKAAIEPFYSKLYLQDGINSLFYSSHVTPMHKHNALQLVFDLKNEFLFRTEYTDWSKHKCLVIKEGINHQLSSNNSIQLILYLDGINPIARHIKEKYLADNDFYTPDITLSLTEEILLQQKLLNPDTASLFTFIQSLLYKLTNVKEEYFTDNRITAVLQLIRETPVADLSIEYLADKIYISPSRLRTLFKKCTKFPLHQYIIRHKILTVITEIINGRIIQDAVYYAGFCDSSHFNKMLKKICDAKPSHFLKENSNCINTHEVKFIFKTELLHGSGSPA